MTALKTHVMSVCISAALVAPTGALARDLLFKGGFESTPTRLCGGPDTDSDTLPDCYEEHIGTSIFDPDTDGDGRPDGEEENEVDRLSPAFPRVPFNPLIADVPDIDIAVAENPVVRIDYSSDQSTSTTISTEESTTSSLDVTAGFSTSTTVGMEFTQTAGTEASTTGASASYEASLSQSWETNVGYSLDTSVGFSETSSRTESAQLEEGFTYEGGELAVRVTLTNPGPLAVEINSITLNASQVDAAGFFLDARTAGGNDEYLEPIGDLGPDMAVNFPIDLAPNDSETFTFSKDDLTLELAETLLADIRNLNLKVGSVSVRDPVDGISYSADLENVYSRTAEVIIDYGPVRGAEKYHVAVRTLPGQSTTPFSALCDQLGIDIQVDDTLGIVSVDGISTRPEDVPPGQSKRWSLLHIESATDSATIYEGGEPVDIQNIDVRARDSIQFALVEDRDGDGVFAREEALFGTVDALNDCDYANGVADTDCDGLDDGEEVHVGWVADYGPGETYDVFSNPLDADQDRDGFTDMEEMANNTDPARPDYNEDSSQRVASESDFNADGFPDFLIGAPQTDIGFDRQGAVFVHQIFAGGNVIVPTRGDLGTEAQNDDFFGFSFATGFFNQDPFADAVVSAVTRDANGVNSSGEIRLVYGTEDGLDFDNTVPLSENILIGRTPQAGDQFGRFLATGDLDGNGLDDIIVGAPFDNSGSSDSGRAYVIYIATDGSVDRTSQLRQGDQFSGDVVAGDQFGRSVATGDFNGDGVQDAAISAPFENVSVIDAGEVVIGYGAQGVGLSSFDRLFQNDVPGQVQEQGDLFGEDLEVADMNADGYDDLIVGAVGEDGGNGAVYILFGGPNGLDQAPAPDGITIAPGLSGIGGADGIAAGDLDGNGFADLVLGYPDASSQRGAILIYFSQGVDGANRPVLPNPQTLTLAAVEAGNGDAVTAIASDRFGEMVRVNDYNRDGIADVLVGAPSKNVFQIPSDDTSTEISNIGRSYLLFGAPGETLSATRQRVLDHPALPDVGAGDGYTFGHLGN